LDHRELRIDQSNTGDLVGLDVVCRSSDAASAKGLHQRSVVPHNIATTVDPSNYLHAFMLHLLTTYTLPSEAHGKSNKVSESKKCTTSMDKGAT
jgi:hypothetical protein